MKLTNTEFEKQFQELSNFYEMRNNEEIHEFIQQNEGLIQLLNEIKPHLVSVKNLTDSFIFILFFEDILFNPF